MLNKQSNDLNKRSKHTSQNKLTLIKILLLIVWNYGLEVWRGVLLSILIFIIPNPSKKPTIFLMCLHWKTQHNDHIYCLFVTDLIKNFTFKDSATSYHKSSCSTAFLILPPSLDDWRAANAFVINWTNSNAMKDDTTGFIFYQICGKFYNSK